MKGGHVDLFSGIGGFALAVRWAGLETVQFVEIGQRCRDFLSKTWPGVPIHDDIKTFHWNMADSKEIRHGCRGIAQEERRQTRGANQGHSDASRPVFLLTGGVPCQPASRAGKQRGAEDDRWLWPEAIRILGESKPTWAVFENPPGIGDVGLAGILSQVENEGYEVRVFSIPACAVGAPHIRERYWIVANCDERGSENRQRGGSDLPGINREWGNVSDVCTTAAECCSSNLADTRQTSGWAPKGAEQYTADRPGNDFKSDVGNTTERERESGSPQSDQRDMVFPGPWNNSLWLPCADGKVRRAPDDSFGLVDGLHRSLLAALGNSIVPQVAYQIIKAIMEVHQ